MVVEQKETPSREHGEISNLSAVSVWSGLATLLLYSYRHQLPPPRQLLAFRVFRPSLGCARFGGPLTTAAVVFFFCLQARLRPTHPSLFQTRTADRGGGGGGKRGRSSDAPPHAPSTWSSKGGSASRRPRRHQHQQQRRQRQQQQQQKAVMWILTRPLGMRRHRVCICFHLPRLSPGPFVRAAAFQTCTRTTPFAVFPFAATSCVHSVRNRC